MLFCFRHRAPWGRHWRTAALSLVLPATLYCASTVSDAGAPSGTRTKTVIRIDRRTGRLVRTVIAVPRLTSVSSAEIVMDELPASAIPEMIETISERHKVDPLLVQAVMEVESSGNRMAISPKGAQGLMQLMPDTARRFGVRNVYNIRENIEGGVRYLRFLHDLFPKDPHLAIAAYNAGEGAVSRYKNTVPPYRETQHYVRKVSTSYQAKTSAAARKRPPVPAASASEQAAEPEYAHVDYFFDSEGRLHLRTLVTP